jgi:hypothetical protein
MKLIFYKHKKILLNIFCIYTYIVLYSNIFIYCLRLLTLEKSNLQLVKICPICINSEVANLAIYVFDNQKNF